MVDCGGVWWSVVECGGMWRGVVSGSGDAVVLNDILSSKKCSKTCSN